MQLLQNNCCNLSEVGSQHGHGKDFQTEKKTQCGLHEAGATG
jgi:hypothetical protein